MARNHPTQIDTLLGTNISPEKSILKMIFLFPRWDMLISWRVFIVLVECFLDLIDDKEWTVLGYQSMFSRWWQLKYFLCSPRTLGKISNLTSIFSKGLKPPTCFSSIAKKLGVLRECFVCFLLFSGWSISPTWNDHHYNDVTSEKWRQYWNLPFLFGRKNLWCMMIVYSHGGNITTCWYLLVNIKQNKTIVRNHFWGE